jgi:hypothetical protein
MDVAALFGIHPQGKVTLASYRLPLSNDTRKFLVKNSWIQTVSMVLLYPLKLILNLGYLVFGFTKMHPLTAEGHTHLFPTVERFLNPKTTLIDFPPQLRAWQEVLEERRGNRIFSIEELRT